LFSYYDGFPGVVAVGSVGNALAKACGMWSTCRVVHMLALSISQLFWSSLQLTGTGNIPLLVFDSSMIGAAAHCCNS
jgi:hypothetical protein